VNISRARLEAVYTSPGGGGGLLRRTADKVAAVAKSNASIHGSIPSTISAGPVVGKSVKVTSGHEASLYVHEGTRPHPIRPRRRGGVLRFVVGGQVVYARAVSHPGYRGDPYLVKALRSVVG
jgi:hypothetical protein